MRSSCKKGFSCKNVKCKNAIFEVLPQRAKTALRGSNTI